jgi:hypothetical protein
MSGPTASQWRSAAAALREHASKWEVLANQIPDDAICGVVSLSGPNQEPLACGYKAGHDGPHAWSTLPTFSSLASQEPAAVSGEPGDATK